MCLAIPGRIARVDQLGENRVGEIEFGGVTRQVYLDFVPEAGPGDYVIVHVGFAISKVDAEEAERIRTLVDELDAVE